jgi:hypothetical protein
MTALRVISGFIGAEALGILATPAVAASASPSTAGCASLAKTALPGASIISSKAVAAGAFKTMPSGGNPIRRASFSCVPHPS